MTILHNHGHTQLYRIVLPFGTQQNRRYSIIQISFLETLDLSLACMYAPSRLHEHLVSFLKTGFSSLIWSIRLDEDWLEVVTNVSLSHALTCFEVIVNSCACPWQFWHNKENKGNVEIWTPCDGFADCFRLRRNLGVTEMISLPPLTFSCCVGFVCLTSHLFSAHFCRMQTL